jgi:hypothetical protein
MKALLLAVIALACIVALQIAASFEAPAPDAAETVECDIEARDAGSPPRARAGGLTTLVVRRKPRIATFGR